MNEGSCQRCFCFGSLFDLSDVATSDWVPSMDQMLLMTSIFLTYMAGVIPSEKSLVNTVERISYDYVFPKETSTSLPGR